LHKNLKSTLFNCIGGVCLKKINQGQNVIIEENVTFGNNVTLGHNVIIYADTVIGDNVIIQDNAVIGKQPTRAKASILPEVNKLQPGMIGAGMPIANSSSVYADWTIANNVFVADL